MKLNKRGYVDTKFVKYLTIEEFKAMDRDIDQNVKSNSMRMLLKFLGKTGLRVGEGIRLQRSNFSRDFSILTYEMEKSDGEIKSRKMPRDLQEEFKDYYNRNNKRMLKEKEDDNESRYMFYASYRNQSGNPHLQRSTVELKLNQITKRTGLDHVYYVARDGKKFHRITPHTFRHFALWRFYEAGQKDIVKAQQIIGHKDPKTTFRYINALASANDEQEIIEKAYAF